MSNRQTNGWLVRGIDGQKDRWTDRQMGTDRLIDKRTHGQTYEKWLDGGTYRWINDGLMGRLRDTDRKTDTQGEKQ